MQIVARGTKRKGVKKKKEKERKIEGGGCEE